MNAWQHFILLLAGKVRVHHGAGRFTDVPMKKLIYSGMNAQQKVYRKREGRAGRQFAAQEKPDGS